MKYDPSSETTIVTPFYNTRPNYFKKYLKSMSKFPNNQIIIGDDGSSGNYKTVLHKLTKDFDNIKIVTFEKNRGMSSTLHDLMDHVETKYVIKCDSDDGLNHFPWSNKGDDFDALVVKNCKVNQIEFLCDRGNGPNGSLYKKEVYKALYRDCDFMDREHKWIHEDVWLHLNLLFSEYKFWHDASEGKVYDYVYARPGSMTAGKQFDDRSPKCETFLSWIRYHDYSPDFYSDIQRKLRKFCN